MDIVGKNGFVNIDVDGRVDVVFESVYGTIMCEVIFKDIGYDRYSGKINKDEYYKFLGIERVFEDEGKVDFRFDKFIVEVSKKEGEVFVRNCESGEVIHLYGDVEIYWEDVDFVVKVLISKD